MLPPSMNDELARQALNERLERAERRMTAASAATTAERPVRQWLGRWMIRVGCALSPDAFPRGSSSVTPDTRWSVSTSAVAFRECLDVGRVKADGVEA